MKDCSFLLLLPLFAEDAFFTGSKIVFLSAYHCCQTHRNLFETSLAMLIVLSGLEKYIHVGFFYSGCLTRSVRQSSKCIWNLMQYLSALMMMALCAFSCRSVLARAQTAQKESHLENGRHWKLSALRFYCSSHRALFGRSLFVLDENRINLPRASRLI